MQVKKLGLRWNELDGDEAVYLSSLLQSMTELNLNGSRINTEALIMIATALAHMETPVYVLRYLKISGRVVYDILLTAQMNW